MTEDDEFSEHFMEDFKRLSRWAENILKYVQDMIDDKPEEINYVFGRNKEVKKMSKKAQKALAEKSKLHNDKDFIELYRKRKFED